jgi:hypothetical protein
VTLADTWLCVHSQRRVWPPGSRRTFVAGDALADPGGWRAVAMTASWALPLTAMRIFALRRAAAAGPVLVGTTALVVLHPDRFRLSTNSQD